MVAALAQSGCSFVFVKGPPANHAEVPELDCSSRRGWPVLDTIGAGLSSVAVVSAAADDSLPATDGANKSNRDRTMVLGLGWLVVSGISALYGFSKVSECRSAKQRRDAASGPRPQRRPVGT
jgi:hypothetical protein